MVGLMMIMFLLSMSMFLWTPYMLFCDGGVLIISRSSGSAIVVRVVV